MEKSELKKSVETIVGAVDGMTSCQWSRVKQHIDMAYSSKAANVVIDDSELLKKNLEREFNYSQSE
ncbi:hypothetical protein D3C74_245690 [compost metagenome]